VSKQSLLLVDGDTRSLRVLEVSLRKAGFMVTAATSVQDALGKLELHAPDLIISETTFPDGDGFELRRRVRATTEWSEIPFIFLTAEAAIENKIRGLELGVDDYLTKPIYIKEIVTRINILLQKRQRVRFEERRDGRTRFTGRVQDMPVVDVIQTIEISRKSGVIQFVGERGRQAAIYFRDGRVIDAEAGALQGEDAVFRLLTWNEGEFEVVFRTVRRREVITMSSQGLLMEGMRRLDEWSRLFEQLPPLTHRFEVDTVELAARLGDVPDDNNRILRLFDGKRTLLEVIDASDVGDLECLQAISRLYFEELLVDLDHDKAPRRDTGKPMPLVELEGIATDDPMADSAASEQDFLAEGSAPEDRGWGGSDEEAVDAESGGSPGAAGRNVDAGPEEAGGEGEDLIASRARASQDAEEAVGEEPAEDAEATEAAEDAESEPYRGPLLGGYRQSSLRLIDEAVAAAQAIEPSLFEDEAKGASAASDSHSANGVAARKAPAASAEGAALPSQVAPATLVNGASRDSLPTIRTDREDSGMRMIGSLGRDRAEASGELAPLGHARARRSETARELVTILPRRVTREMPAVTHELADSLPTPTPTASVLVDQPVATTSIEQPVVATPAPRVSLPGSGVRAPSRSRRLLRIARSVEDGGPGVGALLLIFLAAVLAGTAVFLRLRRHSKPVQVEAVQDAAESSTMSAAPDLGGARPYAREPATTGDGVDRREQSGSSSPPGNGTELGGTAGAAAQEPGRSAAGGKPVSTDGNAPGRPVAGARDTAGGTAGPAIAPVPAGSGSGTAGAARESAGVRMPASAASAGGSTVAAGGSGAVRASAAGGADKTGGRADAGVDKAAEAKALYDKAQYALDESDFTRAHELATASLKLRRTARTYLLRAQAEQRLERVDDALASIDAAAKLAPDLGVVWELRGRILWSARRRDEARAAFEKFLAIEPDSPKAAVVRRLLGEPR